MNISNIEVIQLENNKTLQTTATQQYNQCTCIQNSSISLSKNRMHMYVYLYTFIKGDIQTIGQC